MSIRTLEGVLITDNVDFHSLCFLIHVVDGTLGANCPFVIPLWISHTRTVRRSLVTKIWHNSNEVSPRLLLYQKIFNYMKVRRQKHSFGPLFFKILTKGHIKISKSHRKCCQQVADHGWGKDISATRTKNWKCTANGPSESLHFFQIRLNLVIGVIVAACGSSLFQWTWARMLFQTMLILNSFTAERNIPTTLFDINPNLRPQISLRSSDRNKLRLGSDHCWNVCHPNLSMHKFSKHKRLFVI